MSQKGIKGWPIRFAEIGKRFSAVSVGSELSSAQNESPVRRLKPSSSFRNVPRIGFINLVSPLDEVARYSPIPERMISAIHSCAHKLVTPCHAGFRWNRAVALQFFRAES